MTTLNNHLKLAIRNRKKSKNALQKGFTLIELLITVVILGTLSAIALPNFLGVKEAANQKSAIASATALAKDCSGAILADLPAPSQLAADAPQGVTLVDTEKCGTNTKTYTAAGLTPKADDRCLLDKAITTNTTCTIQTSSTGQVSGQWN